MICIAFEVIFLFCISLVALQILAASANEAARRYVSCKVLIVLTLSYMEKALETLHALRLIAELRGDRVAWMQIKRDIHYLEKDILNHKPWVL